MVGYGFGASFVALFMQLGGGIYTKAADVGADMVGKIEVYLVYFYLLKCFDRLVSQKMIHAILLSLQIWSVTWLEIVWVLPLMCLNLSQLKSLVR